MTPIAAVRVGSFRLLPWATATLVAVAAGVTVAEPAGVRLGFAAAIGLVLVAAALRLRPAIVLSGLIVWLVALGLIRRLTSGVSPKQAWGDPLLLVGAGVWIALALFAVSKGALDRRTPLTNAVFVLGSLLAISAVNPQQGGLMVGLSGALLVVVPMVAFLVGRALVDDRVFSQLLRVAAGLGVVVAVYGLAQTFSGFPAWDQAWIDNEGYTALNVSGVIRAFASFSAASEYAGFLGVAVVSWVAHARRPSHRPLLVSALGLLLTALWYESSRGILVLTIGAVSLMVAARAGLSLVRALVVGVAVLAAAPTIVGWLAPDRFSDDAEGTLVEHQVEGLADPFGAGSTLPAHISLIRGGIESAFRNPVGTGVGSITISGSKYGGASGSSEGDPGRAPFAVGLPGLAAYLAVVVIGVSKAYRVATLRRDPVSLAALGVVTVTLFQWLNGGQYAVVFWPWLVFGWLERCKSPDDQHSGSSDTTRDLTAEKSA